MTLLGDALSFPLVALARYIAGENPGAADASRDALRIAPGKSPAVALYGTEAVPLVLGASLARIALADIDTTMASVCTFYVQLKVPSTDVTAAQIGLGLEASHDGLTFYIVPFIGAVDATTTIYPTVDGSGSPPTDGGFVDATETTNRALWDDMVYFPVNPVSLVTESGSRAAMRAIAFNVRGYRAVRGILVPLYTTDGDVPLCSVVANLAT